jgi:subtilisin
MSFDDIPLDRRELLFTTAGAFGTLGLAGEASADALVEVNVGVRNDAGRAAARRAAAEVKREFAFDALTVRAAPSAAAGLESNPNVRYVEENGTMEAFEQTTPYGIEVTEADLAIDDGNTGAGVDVAVIDTGIDAQHETLEANLGEGYATTDAACTTNCSGGGPGGGGGNDIGECLAEWDDDNDHGTHCAGTAAAADDGTGVLGVAPEATLHAVKVLACDGSGSFDDIAAGIEWSADQGHDVQSMSLGADTDSSVVKDALQYAADTVDAALHAYWNEPLAPTEAAQETDYTADHISRLIREDRVPTAGENGRKVRRKHLPRKPGSGRPGGRSPNRPSGSRSRVARTVLDSE